VASTNFPEALDRMRPLDKVDFDAMFSGIDPLLLPPKCQRYALAALKSVAARKRGHLPMHVPPLHHSDDKRDFESSAMMTSHVGHFCSINPPQDVLLILGRNMLTGQV
jgi:hypothetical protein